MKANSLKEEREEVERALSKHIEKHDESRRAAQDRLHEFCEGLRAQVAELKSRVNSELEENFTEEVILWVILAISILLFISNFGIGGAIGNAVSSFFFGVFGLIAYIFPCSN